MAGEFVHADVGGELTEAEYHALLGHVLDGQARGDLIISNSAATGLVRLAAGAVGQSLQMGANDPVWATAAGGGAQSLLDDLIATRAILLWCDFTQFSAEYDTNPIGDGIGLRVAVTGGANTTGAEMVNGKILVRTSTGSGNYIQLRTDSDASGPCEGQWSPRFACALSTQAGAAALERQAIGFSSGNGTAFGTGGHLALFRSETTGNLFAVTRDGSTEETTDLSGTHSTGDEDRFQVESDNAGVSWKFSIAGSVVATHSTNVPATAQNLTPGIHIRNNTTTQVEFRDVDYVLCDQDRESL